MKQKSIREIKQELKKLAKAFNLKYNSGWFNFIFISRRLNVLTEYIGNCPDPIYNKFGKNPETRIKNIDKFISSKEFKKCLKRIGGQVATKKDLEQEYRWINKIGSNELKRGLLELHKKIKKKLKNKDYIALLTETANKKQYNWLLTFILRHEWLHILLEKNKIYFQEKNKRYWKYDEGLVTYLEAFLDKTLNLLEARAKITKYPVEKQDYIYAVKFKKLLKNKDTPSERKKTIFDLIKELK